MVDVNPADTISRYTPRSSDLVDAVAEARRIATQQMRSNPMEDAVVTKGLTRFVGNYGSDYAWFGEFTPPDQNMVDEFGNLMPQRGVVFWRDDPQHNIAFALYDWDPQVGVPLRQKIAMNDADGKVMMQEGPSGGRRFPDKAIPLYPRINIESPGGGSTTDEIVFMGSGNLIGTHMHVGGTWVFGGGSATMSGYVRFSGGGVNVNGPAFGGAGASGSFNQIVDISAVFDAADFVTVEVHMWRSAGAALNYFPKMSFCRNYSD